MDCALALVSWGMGFAMTQDEISAIKEEIRSVYALPVRDFLEFIYRERFPEDTSARVAFVLGHYNYFLNAVSRPPAELNPHRESLMRLCIRFGVSGTVLEEVNQALVFELMKITAVQRRNSPETMAAYGLVVALIAHGLFSSTDTAAQSPRRFRLG